jgi:hypothetical protein
VQGVSAVRWQGTMDVCVHIIAVRSCFNHAFNVKTCFNHAVKDTERLFYRRPRAHDTDSRTPLAQRRIRVDDAVQVHANLDHTG